MLFFFERWYLVRYATSCQVEYTVSPGLACFWQIAAVGHHGEHLISFSGSLLSAISLPHLCLHTLIRLTWTENRKNKLLPIFRGSYLVMLAVLDPFQ